MTARETAKAYSPGADWIPCDRQMPPINETVRVLYADGMVYKGERVGKLFIDSTGSYRYVEAKFWQPID
jgi:hypothetical protein